MGVTCAFLGAAGQLPLHAVMREAKAGKLAVDETGVELLEKALRSGGVR